MNRDEDVSKGEYVEKREMKKKVWKIVLFLLPNSRQPRHHARTMEMGLR